MRVGLARGQPGVHAWWQCWSACKAGARAAASRTHAGLRFAPSAQPVLLLGPLPSPTHPTNPSTTSTPPPPAAKSRNGAAPLRVVAYDYGIKQNILRRLTSFGCKVRAPACT